MSTTHKKKIIHEVLGVLSSGTTYTYSNEDIYNELMRKRNWAQKLIRKKYSIPSISYACNIIKDEIGKEALFVVTGARGDTGWMIGGNDGITIIRGYYNEGAFKEPRRWWVRSLEIAIGAGAIVSMIGVGDTLQSPALRDKISQEKGLIELLKSRITKDSIVLDSIQDLLEILKNSKSDSSKKD